MGIIYIGLSYPAMGVCRSGIFWELGILTVPVCVKHYSSCLHAIDGGPSSFISVTDSVWKLINKKNIYILNRVLKSIINHSHSQESF